jgi:hypothetical protein
MSFGDRLFQLAQGIISNERQRKAQELAAERFEFQKQQATESLALQKKTIEAKEEFNEIQRQFQQIKLDEAGDEDAKKLRQDLTQSQINLNNAQAARFQAAAAGTGTATDLKPKDVFQIRTSVDNNAREIRVQSTINDIMAGTPPDPIPGTGADHTVIAQGLNVARVKSKVALQQKIEDKERQIQTQLQAFGGLQGPEETTVIQKLRNDQTAMQKAFDELNKIESAIVSETEFVLSAASVGGITRELATDMYRNVQPAGVHRERIFGAGALSDIEHRAAILDLKAGNTSTIVRLVRQTPTDLLDNGILKDQQSIRQLDAWLTSEGIIDKEQRNAVSRALKVKPKPLP